MRADSNRKGGAGFPRGYRAPMTRGLLRLLLVETARGALPPDEPEVLRAAAGLLFRVEHHARRETMHALVTRAPAGSRRAAEAMAREALDVDLQRRLEELVLPRVEPAWVERYARVHGHVGPSDLLVAGPLPHPMVALVALAAAVPGLAAVRPAPEAPRDLGTRLLARRFAAERQRLAVRWVEAPVDGPVFLVLGQARLPPGRPVRAVLVHRERDKRWQVEVAPASADVGAVLAEHAARWPGQHLVTG